ncbi:MAG: iron ABC transporter permease [Bryobacterales bacterium]|nr:iron ABC transporter permease [Bryobacteraceae bacterium]MDW8355205.1 iron ABC transporter permease [Bryobacterales bacterium]
MSRQQVRRWLFFTVAPLVLGGLLVAAVLASPTGMRPSTTLRVLAGRLLPEGLVDLSGLKPVHFAVVWDLRLPRVVVGTFVGSALAVAGAVLQALFRNPLAEPGLTGASAGAVFGAVVAFAMGWSAAEPIALPLAAMSGALLALLTVYAMATRGGVTPIPTLLLAGVAVSSLLSAAAGLILSLQITNWQVAQEILFWTLGGLEARTWTHVWLCLPFAGIGLVCAATYCRELDLMQQGEETAAALGVEVETVKRVLIACAAILTGAAVAVAGVIGFVGLVAPHAMRLILGSSHRWLLPSSALAGAILLLACDLLARTLRPPLEIRLGVVTALVGGPLFIALLLRRHREGWAW